MREPNLKPNEPATILQPAPRKKKPRAVTHDYTPVLPLQGRVPALVLAIVELGRRADRDSTVHSRRPRRGYLTPTDARPARPQRQQERTSLHHYGRCVGVDNNAVLVGRVLVNDRVELRRHTQLDSAAGSGRVRYRGHCSRRDVFVRVRCEHKREQEPRACIWRS